MIKLRCALFAAFTVFLVCATIISTAQNTDRSIRVKYISSTITIDGVLDETEWKLAEKGGDFWQIFPSDKERSMNLKVSYWLNL